VPSTNRLSLIFPPAPCAHSSAYQLVLYIAERNIAIQLIKFAEMPSNLAISFKLSCSYARIAYG